MSIDLLAPARVDHVRGKGVRVSVRGLSENGDEGLPKGGLIARRQSSKPFEHEGGSMVVRTGLRTDGLSNPAPCQSWTWTSPTDSVDGC